MCVKMPCSNNGRAWDSQAVPRHRSAGNERNVCWVCGVKNGTAAVQVGAREAEANTCLVTVQGGTVGERAIVQRANCQRHFSTRGRWSKYARSDNENTPPVGFDSNLVR
jgi:hypothetical protein